MGVKRAENKKNYHWEIWRWEVEYERVQKASVSRSYYITSTTNVYDFLSAFPEKRTAKEFLITDLMDFLVSLQREKGYSHNSCARIGHDIAAFWNWMRRYKDQNLPSMRCDSFEARRMQIPALTEQQFFRLVDACRSAEERQVLREALLGTPVREITKILGLKGQALPHRWNRFRKRAGVPWVTMRTLSKSYRGMLLRLGAKRLTELLGTRTYESLPEPRIPDNGNTLLELAP